MSCSVWSRTFFCLKSWLYSLLMIKILNSQQIKALDTYTIQHEPIASIDLMERACRAFCFWFTDRFDTTQNIGVVCGTGNNGGDGLGIARLLNSWDYPVRVWVIKGSGVPSEDFQINLSRLGGKVEVVYLQEGFDGRLFSSCDVLIDAIFGSGLSRPVDGLYAAVIESMNESNTVRISVDIPSGLFADKPTEGRIVNAHHTISFQLPKLAFFFPSNYPVVGEWRTVNIGLSKDGIRSAATANFLLTMKSMSKLLKPLNKFDHKGTRGRALLIAGSYGKMGAAVLASRGALRTGVGLLTVHVPKIGYNIVQTSVPEAMASVDDSEYFFSSIPDLTSYDALGTGPGLGQDKNTVKALKDVLEKFGRPVVLDADAINIVGSNRELLHVVPKGSIFTPHPTEFERLVGSWKNEFERLEKQKEFSFSFSVVLVLKGAHTSITTPDGKVYFNKTGNPGMATGGTGDVLTGIITALLAGGYASLEAAQLGVFLHGLAGDEAAKKRGMRGLIASEIIDHLSDAFVRLR